MSAENGSDFSDRSKEVLMLKWGTLKGYSNLYSAISQDLVKAYYDEPVSLGVMQQRDTDKQKKILIELINGFEGKITNSWSGENMTTDEAVEYITNYGKDVPVLPL